MEFDRFTGKTLEEALDAAAQAKDAELDELTYTVLDEKTGFLGIGKVVEIAVYCSQDIKQFIADYIQNYFDNAELDGEVTVWEDEPDFYKVSVDTNSNARLIGKEGRGLQDFNRLVKAAASAAFKTRVRLLIDVNGYKEDRYDKVCRMARRLAKEVRRTKVEAVLSPMPADERKAVHNALADMPGITTKSHGEGAERRLHILYSPEKTK